MDVSGSRYTFSVPLPFHPEIFEQKKKTPGDSKSNSLLSNFVANHFLAENTWEIAVVLATSRLHVYLSPRVLGGIYTMELVDGMMGGIFFRDEKSTQKG